MGDLILSIDCGTQSLRALLFDTEGALLGRSQVAYEPYFSPRPGWAEQDADVFWESLVAAVKKLKEMNPSHFSRIAGVGVTTQRNSMVNVDEGGRPLRPVITWLDQRKAKECYHPAPPAKLVYRIVGMAGALSRIQREGKCNWIIQNQPEIWSRTHKYLQVSGFLNYRLTGRFRDSVASQIGHAPFNYRKGRWAKKRELAARLFPICRKKLPELIAPGLPLGAVTAEAAKACGLPVGIPVIACASDKGCETLGVGIRSERTASLSFGTTATVQTTTKRYFEPLRFMPPYPAAIPGHFNPEVEIFRGYWMITWFRNEFAHKDVEEANRLGVPPEVILDRLLCQAPPGAMGLMVQPYWGPGLKQPEAKGAMIGFGDLHKRAHVYRAVIEGLGYALREGLTRIERGSGVRVERLAVSGGASRSDAICRISADIFNRPLVRGRTAETSGLGAAIITAVGLGIHPSFCAAIERMTRREKIFEPNPENAALYDNLYRKVYRKLYGKMKPLYEAIQDITGYPEH